MGKYFNPPTKQAVEAARGRLLQLLCMTPTYDECKRLLRDYEVLFGRFNRGFFYVMPLLHNEEEFEEFMSQYNAGHLLSYEFYAMPSSVFDIDKTSSTSASTVTSAATSTADDVVSTATASATADVASSATADAASSAASSVASSVAVDAASSAV